MNEDIRRYRYYRHYKGGVYLVLNIAKNTETGEDYVVYTDNWKTWVRPLSMWFDEISPSTKRFTLIPLL